jgi:hypothetical protein
VTSKSKQKIRKGEYTMVNIVIKSEKYFKDSEPIKNFFENEIKKNPETLLLDSLERVIISDDFSNEVKKIQVEYLKSPSGHSEGAIAIVIHKIEGDKIIQTIILSEYVIDKLLSEDFYLDAYHTIHHELCHVHDEYQRFVMNKINGSRTTEISQLDELLIQMSGAIWSEYIAVMLSLNSLYIIDNKIHMFGGDFHIEYLLRLIDSSYNEIKKAKEIYMEDNDLSNFFLLVRRETSILFRIAASTIGYTEGLRKNQTIDCDIADKLIRETYFYSSWVELKNSLDLLFCKYPNWKSSDDVIEIGNVLMKYWNGFDIYPSTNPETNNVYIGVNR